MDNNSFSTALEIKEILGLKNPPTEEQAKVISYPIDQPFLVVAGAGSGKTTTMASRVAYWIAKGEIKPEEVLALTFSRKAAEELAERINQQINYAYRNMGAYKKGKHPAFRKIAPEVGTYDSFAAKVVQEFSMQLQINPNQRLINHAQAWQIMYEIVQNYENFLQVRDAQGIKGAETLVRDALSIATSLQDNNQPLEYARKRINAELQKLEMVAVNTKPSKRTLASISEDMDYETEVGVRLAGDSRKIYYGLLGQRELLDIIKLYQERKQNLEITTFGDRQLQAIKAVENQNIAKQIRNRYKIILLDEYQDTSVLQNQFLSTIFQGAGVCAVGDPNQAIYGFRGASATALVDFCNLFAATNKQLGAETRPNIEVLELTTSFRNNEQILLVANKLSKRLNKKRTINKKSSRSLKVSPLKAFKSSGLTPPKMKKIAEWRAYLQPEVSVNAHTNREEEDKALIDFFQSNLNENNSGAILCRTNEQVRYYREILLENSVPVIIDNPGQILLIPEIRLICLTLESVLDLTKNGGIARLFIDFGGNLADLRALSLLSQKTDFTKGSLLITVKALGEKLISLKGISDASRISIARLTKLFADIQAHLILPLPALINYLYKRLYLDIENKLLSPSGIHKFEISVVEKFIHEVVESYVRDNPQATVAAFLGWINTAIEQNNEIKLSSEAKVAEVKGAVRILTMHASKGLEWDMVAIPNLVEGKLPKRSGANSNYSFINDSGWLGKRAEIPYFLRRDQEVLPILDISNRFDSTTLNRLIKCFRLRNGQRALIEETRLAYVAFTRARNTLYLSYALYDEHSDVTCRPSRFIGEIEPTTWIHTNFETLSDLNECEKVGSGRSESSIFHAELSISQKFTCEECLEIYEEGDELIAKQTKYLELFTPPEDESQNIAEVDDDGEIAYAEEEPSQLQNEEAPLDFSTYLQEVKTSLAEPGRSNAKGITSVQLAKSLEEPRNQLSYPLDPLGKTGDQKRAVARQIEKIKLALQASDNAWEKISTDPDFNNLAGQKILKELKEKVQIQRERFAPLQLEVSQSLSASSVVSLLKDPQAWVLAQRRPLPSEPTEAATTGTNMHGWIANYYNSDVPLAIFAEKVEELLPDEEAQACQKVFEHPANPWGAATPVAIEQPCWATLLGRVVNCTIDAVFKVDSKWQVVDWKTGNPPDLQSDDFQARAAQITLYRHAWAQEKGVDPAIVEGYICFLGKKAQTKGEGPIIVPVPQQSIAELENQVLEALARTHEK